MATAERLLSALADLLGSHEDYSLLASLKRLQSVTETNPSFERTLKNNASCEYCRAYIYENAARLYLPEMRALWACVREADEKGSDIDKASVAASFAAIHADYMRTPLSEMQGIPCDFAKLAASAADVIANGNADILEK